MLTEDHLYKIQLENEFNRRIIPENINQYSLEQICEQLRRDEDTINYLICELLELKYRLDKE